MMPPTAEERIIASRATNQDDGRGAHAAFGPGLGRFDLLFHKNLLDFSPSLSLREGVLPA